MNLSEEQIKHILQSIQAKTGPDLELENTIMDEIKMPNSYKVLIQKNQWYARTSLWASIVIAACLILFLFYRLYSSPPLPTDELAQLLPSLTVVAVLFILSQLLYFSMNLGADAGARKC
jgi:hypothetical protein